MWLKLFTDSYKRMLPMHIMHSNVGHEICLVILRLLVLMRCHVTSIIGTKYEALNAKPIYYLKTFGKNKYLCHEEAEKVESHLVKFLRLLPAYTTREGLQQIVRCLYPLWYFFDK